MKPKLDKASKVEKLLQKFDPDIDIPDTEDIEGELEDAADRITNMVDTIKSSLDLRKYFPKPAQSQELFDKYLVYPILAIYLVIQLVSVYFLTSGTKDGSDSASTVDTGGGTSEIMRLLRGLTSDDFTEVDAPSSNITSATSNTVAEPETYMEEVDDQFELIVVTFFAYLVTAIQILISWLATQRQFLTKLINKKILTVSKIVNGETATTVKPIFHDIFVVSLEKIKTKLLKLIGKVQKIEVAMSNVSKKPPSIGSFFGLK